METLQLAFVVTGILRVLFPSMRLHQMTFSTSQGTCLNIRDSSGDRDPSSEAFDIGPLRGIFDIEKPCICDKEDFVAMDLIFCGFIA